MKFTRYIVVTGASIGAFNEEMDRFLSDGWEPQGGVQVTWDGQTTRFFQAVVRGEQPSLSPTPSRPSADTFKSPPQNWPAVSAAKPAPAPRPESAPVPRQQPLVSLPQTTPVTPQLHEHRALPELLPLPLRRSARAEITAQFLKIGSKRYTIFDAVELPDHSLEMSCTLPLGDRLLDVEGRFAEFDEKGQTTGKGRILSVSRKNTMAIVTIVRTE